MVTKNKTNSSSKNSKQINENNLYDLYREHYKNFIYQPDTNVSELYAACHYLWAAIVAGDKRASASAFISADEFLSYHISKRIEDEFYARLRKIDPNSKHFDAANEALFYLLYFKYYRSHYFDPLTRMDELRNALYALCRVQAFQSVKTADFFNALFDRDEPFPNKKLVRKAVKPVANMLLIRELSGVDPLFNLLVECNIKSAKMTPKNVTYPFKLMSHDSYHDFISSLVFEREINVSNLLYKYKENYEGITIIPVSSLSSVTRYTLRIVPEMLDSTKHPLIGFVDLNSGDEIARIENANNQVLVTGHGNDLLIYAENIELPNVCIFENKNSSIKWYGDIQAEKSIYLGLDVDNFTCDGVIGSDVCVSVDSSGKVILLKNSDLVSDGNIQIKANAFECHSHVNAGKNISIDIRQEVILSHECEVNSSVGISIKAGALKDVRANIQTQGPIKCEIKRDVYIHGSAHLNSDIGIEIKARTVFCTDKSILQSKKGCLFEAKEKLVFDKQAACTAESIAITSPVFENYSPNISANILKIRCEVEGRNHPLGCIATDNMLLISGGSFWNGGEIHFGHVLQVQLNKMFVHGLSNWSVSGIQNALTHAKIYGEQGSVVAGAVLDILGYIEVKAWNLSAIVEVGGNLTMNLNQKKSRLIAVEFGIDLPNFRYVYEQITTFCREMAEGHYGDALKSLFSIVSSGTSMNVVRWLIKTLFPAVGKPVDLAWSTLMAIASVPALFQKAKGLYDKSQSGETIEYYDLYALAATVDSVVMQGINIEGQIESGISAGWIINSAGHHPVDVDSLALSLASLFLPGSVDEAVVNTGFGGLHASGSLTHRSFFSYEALVSNFGLNVSDSFYMRVQTDGLVVANNVSNIGHKLERSGLEVSGNDSVNVEEMIENSKIETDQVIWQVNTLDEKAEIAARDVIIHADSIIKHSGNIHADHLVNLETDELKFDTKSHLEGAGVNMHATKANLSGAVHAKQFNLEVKGAATLESDYVLEANAASIHAKNLNEKGSIRKISTDVSSHDALQEKDEASQDDKDKMKVDILLHADEEITIEEKSTLDANDGVVALEAKNISDAGKHLGKEFAFLADQSVILQDSAEFIDSNSTIRIETTNFDGSGTLNVNSLGVYAKDRVTLNDKMQITANSIVLQSKGDINDKAIIHATNAEHKISDNKDEIHPDIVIQGKHISIDKAASFKGEHSTLYIKGDTIDDSGKIDVAETVLQAEDRISLSQQSHVSAEKITVDAGKMIDQAGEMIGIASSDPSPVVSDNDESKNEENTRVPDITLHAKQVNLSGKIQASQETIYIDGESINDASCVEAKILVEHANEHLNVLSDANHNISSTVAYEAKTASFSGSVNADTVDFEVSHLDHVNELISRSGTYNHVKPTSTMVINTDDDVTLTRDNDLDFSLSLSAKKLEIGAHTLHSSQDIELKSTEGDITVNRGTVKADHVLSVSAQGSLINTRGHFAASSAYFDAHGNIINTAGLIEAGGYLQLRADGNIENRYVATGMVSQLDMEEKWQNAIAHILDGKSGNLLNIFNIANDLMNQCDKKGQYEIGHILGGKGGDNGIGLHMQAGGKIINDASEIASTGSNVIEGKQGIETDAAYHKYLSDHRVYDSWWKHDETWEYSYQVQEGLIYSVNGSNSLYSSEGSISSRSTNFVSAHDNIFSAKGNIDLKGYVLKNETYKEKHNWFNSKETHNSDEYAVPTIVQNPENMRIVSSDGDVNISNAALITDGAISIHGKNIITSSPILDHSIETSSSGFGVSSPALSAINGAALVDDYNAMRHAHGAGQWVSSLWNTGIDGINTVNSVIGGMRNGSWSQALFSTSMLTSINVDYAVSKSKQSWQSVASNTGISCGSLEIDATDTISFIDGVAINVLEDAQIHAKTFKQQGARLDSSYSSHTEKVSIGVSLSAAPTVGVSASESSSQQRNYQNQSFHVGGNLSVKASDWDIVSSNIDAGTLDAQVDSLSIRSLLDTSSSHSWSGSVSTTGNFSISKSRSDSKTLGLASGIHTTGDLHLSAHTIDLDGARITSDAACHVQADTITAKTVHESANGSSFSFGANVNDFSQHSNQGPGQWNQSIRTGSLGVGYTDYKAEQASTICGATETDLQADNIQGNLNTLDASGHHVSRNDNFDINLKVPISGVSEGIKQTNSNLAWAGHRLFDAKPRAVPPIDTTHEIKFAGENNKNNDNNSIYDESSLVDTGTMSASPELLAKYEQNYLDSIANSQPLLPEHNNHEEFIQGLSNDFDYSTWNSAGNSIDELSPDFTPEGVGLYQQMMQFPEFIGNAALGMSDWTQDTLYRYTHNNPFYELGGDIKSSAIKIWDVIDSSCDQTRTMLRAGLYKLSSGLIGSEQDVLDTEHAFSNTMEDVSKLGSIIVDGKLGDYGYNVGYNLAPGIALGLGAGAVAELTAGVTISKYAEGYFVQTQMALGRSDALKNIGIYGEKNVASVAERTERMLRTNTGYNVSPENWFTQYTTIGRDGTYITDYRAVSKVIGPQRANTQFEMGLFSRGNKISYFKAARLEQSLGLEPGSLTTEGFRFTRIPNIVKQFPRSPIYAENPLFEGGGMGLPNGDPELVIDPISTHPWP